MNSSDREKERRMNNTRFSLQDMTPAQRTSLENILDKTNHEYENEYQSLTEKEAIINRHRLQFQASLKSSKNRIQNLLKYSNELDIKRNMIDTERETLESQAAEAFKFIESEIKINEETLSRSQHELELVLQKLTYAKTTANQLQKKVNDLENIEGRLILRETELENKIKESNENRPKRAPEKIKQEIDVINKNIPEVNKQIQSRENYIVQREMRKVQFQSERSNLEKKMESIQKVISEHLQKSGLKNDAIRTSISSKIERLTSLETTRTEKKMTITNMRSRIDHQTQKVEELTKNLKDIIQKVEDTKNKLSKKLDETETSIQKYQELKNLIEVTRARRMKSDTQLSNELMSIRQEYRKAQKKFGSERYAIEEAKKKKKELKEALKSYQQQLFQSDVEYKKLKLKKEELNQLEFQIQEEEIRNERQYKLDIITLDDLQKNIGRGQLKMKQLMDDRLDLLSPTITTVERYKSLSEIERKYEEEAKVLNTSMSIKDLKKELNKTLNSIENLKFECTKFKEQKKFNKKQLLLKKVDLEHARNIQQYFEHEKLTHDQNQTEEKLVFLRSKEFEIFDLIRKIEKKNEEILERKKNLKIKLVHISEVIEKEKMKNFGSNVSLAVTPGFDSECNNDVRNVEMPPLQLFDVRKIVQFDKLEKFFRTIQVEKRIWCNLVNPSSITSILETWNNEIQKFLDL